MKVVILCGGRGLRLGEQGLSVPKALLEIGGRPILWHVMKTYSRFGLCEFILCLGHLGDQIRQYFLDRSDSHQVLREVPGRADILSHYCADGDEWRVTLTETGAETNTGGRVRQVLPHIGNGEDFFVTYCDGLADIPLDKLLGFHRAHGRPATLTAVHPASNFGILQLDGDGVIHEFQEKPRMTEWANGGFFVFRREIVEYLSANSILEREPLERLARESRVMAYRHCGFWACMDTYKDHAELQRLWEGNQAKWKTW